MKKLLLLFLILLCSCSSETTRVYSEGEIPFGEIHTFTYKNHTYICFKKDSSYSIIHDPECKFCYDIFD